MFRHLTSTDLTISEESLSMTEMKRRILYISLFCIYVGSVLFLCLMKPDNLPEKEIFLFGLPADKVAHFTMFLPFTVLSYLVFFNCKRKKSVDIAILAASLFVGAGAATGTEVLQTLTMYRSAEIHDFYADLSGLCTGALAVLLYILAIKKTDPQKTRTE